MRLLIAGGGTGGHIYPGVAIAQEVSRQDQHACILFVGQRSGLSMDILRREDWSFHSIKGARVASPTLRSRLGALMRLPYTFGQSWKIVHQFAPEAVFGLGGYSSAPVILAGLFLGIPCYLQEQNVYPGLTNRLFSYWADTVFISYPETAKYLPAAKKTMLAGNPVRSKLREANREESRRQLGLSPEKFTALVFGGSQGAHRLNTGIVEALPSFTPYQDELQIIHQTGEGEYEQVSSAYKKGTVAAYIKPFIHNMASAYAAADLVVCRAGAGTIAELTSLGKPAILVPYPFAADAHQQKNAEALTHDGAAQLIPDGRATGERLGSAIIKLMQDRKELSRMSARSKALGKQDAAAKIASYILNDAGYEAQAEVSD